MKEPEFDWRRKRENCFVEKIECIVLCKRKRKGEKVSSLVERQRKVFFKIQDRKMDTKVDGSTWCCENVQ